MREAEERSLAAIESGGVAELAAPTLIVAAGAAAGFAWDEFFIGKLHDKIGAGGSLGRFATACFNLSFT